MTRHFLRFLLSLFVFFPALGSVAPAFNIINPGDPILAIDLDFSSGSDSPGGEQVENILDGDSSTKYLNFGDDNTGFIVTPAAASVLQSFVLTTANDAFERDPSSYILYGTNDPITSAPHSAGRSEAWTEIAMGDLSLPDDRFATGAPVGFSNASSYASYKMVFPTTKTDVGLMQVADVGFFASLDGSGANILQIGNPIIPIRDVDPMPSSNSPGAEGAEFSIDRDANTKYLNFGGERSGLIVTPSNSGSIVNGFQITTANDAAERDPASWELYGTNDPIVTENNGIGDQENWTLIDSGSLALPAERLTPGGVVTVNNSGGAFNSYRMIFPTVKDAAAANSMQIADFELLADEEALLEINRQTGEVILTATVDLTIDNYELRSATSGGLERSGWTSIASSGADPNDVWSETSDVETSLAEADAAGGSDDGFSLQAGNSYSLGNIWRALPSATEDLIAILTDPDGEVIGTNVQFTGTEILLGDYSRDGFVGPEDWVLFRAGFGGEYAGSSPAEAYLGGDLDGDFDSDIHDFNALVAAAGGLAALLGTAEVPEPNSLFLLVAGSLLLPRRRVSHRPAAMICLVAPLSLAISPSAIAQSFSSVGDVPAGISIPAGQENENEMSGPENLFDDFLIDGGTAIDGALFLTDYSQPDVFGDPYLQYAGLNGNAKTVFLDYGSPVTADWFAYAQRSGADPTADRVGMFEFWFSNTDFGDVVPDSNPDAVVKLLPDDPRLQDSLLRPYSLSGAHTGQFVAMRLTLSELSASQPVNNIGGHQFRLMDGPGDVILQVDRGSGEMTLSNDLPDAQRIELKAYTVESPSGGLVAENFNGVGGDSGVFPAGTGNGNGWEIGEGSNANRLAEAIFSGIALMPTNTSDLPLGNAYNPLSRAEDLVFTWTDSFGQIYNGRVEYIGDAPPGTIGDYDDDQTVSLVDYTVWRDNLGADISLPNDATPGSVDDGDYNRWKENFAALAASGRTLQSTPIPEPAAVIIFCIGSIGLACGNRKLRTS